MLNLKQEHKVGVVVGLIASILFTYFLQPIFDWVSGVVVKVLTIASSAYLDRRSEEHTSELQSLMRISYAVFCLKKKIPKTQNSSDFAMNKLTIITIIFNILCKNTIPT